MYSLFMPISIVTSGLGTVPISVRADHGTWDKTSR